MQAVQLAAQLLTSVHSALPNEDGIPNLGEVLRTAPTERGWPTSSFRSRGDTQIVPILRYAT